MRALLILGLLLKCILANAEDTFSPPASSASAVLGIDFNGKLVGEKFRSRFLECDSKNTCDGKQLKYGCSNDPNNNSALLELKGGAIFYDAKMGLDADGSPYSKKTPGQTNQPQTSLRYPINGKPSINADRVSYIVIPFGGFDKALGVQVGDVAAVVRGSKREFAVVADQGPVCKIGEGSIQLHEALDHEVCKQRDSNGDCVKLKNVGVEKDVLYFIFPGTHKKLLPELTPDNITNRINTIGLAAWEQLVKP